MQALPKHITGKVRKWCESVTKEYDLSPTQFQLLVMAAEFRQQADTAREQVAKHGAIVKDRFGQDKESPHAKLMRDAALSCSRLLREIGLAIDDSDDARPPRVGG